jgi:hypothetical protein
VKDLLAVSVRDPDPRQAVLRIRLVRAEFEGDSTGVLARFFSALKLYALVVLDWDLAIDMKEISHAPPIWQLLVAMSVGYPAVMSKH